MKIFPVVGFALVVMNLAGCSASTPANIPQPHSTPDTTRSVQAEIPEWPVDISLENTRFRAQLGKPTTVFARGAVGFTSETNIQLCVNAEVVATMRERVGSVAWFEWIPKTLGSNSLALRVSIGERVVLSRTVQVQVTNFKRPKLSWDVPPKSPLWTTNELVFTVKASDEDGAIVTTRVYRDDMDQWFVTNTEHLSVKADPLPPGTYLYHVQAVDDDLQTSEPLQFTLDVDATEHPEQESPSGLIVEPATLPGQRRPANWYPGWPDKSVRIGGASDALQLKWNPPQNRNSLFGTLIQRTSAPAEPWRTVGMVDREFCEWRDQRLHPETYYRYRIAFVSSDKVFRSRFTPEQGECTSIAGPSYTPVPIGTRP
jgi:hypothetical protein